MSEEIRDKDEVTPVPEEPAAPLPQAEAEVPAAAAPREAKNSAIPPEELERLNNDLVAAFKTVYDPEIPVDIYELGLIYDMQIDGRTVDVTMTLTSPGCPVAGEMPGMVERAVAAVEGVEQVNVELVWSPPWDMSRMSPGARLELGMD